MTTARMARDRDVPQRRVAVDAGSVDVNARTAERSTRDQLVMEHVGLVKSLAQRLAQRLPAQVEMTDLVSVGVLGLIDAATPLQAVDSACPSTRSPAAACRARCSMRCAISTGRRARCASCGATSTQRSPGCGTSWDASRTRTRSPPRWACREAEYARALEQMRSLELGALRQLDAPTPDGTPLIELCIDPDEGPEARLERDGAPRRISPVRSPRLPDRERQILALYYEEELTMAEIGEVIGVVRVARLAAALARAVAPAHAAPRVARPGPCRRDRWARSFRRKKSTRCSDPPTTHRERNAAVPRPQPGAELHHATTSAGRTASPRSRCGRCTSCTTASRATWLTSLSAYLRTVTDIIIVSVEQFAYSEFLMSLPDPTAFYAVSLQPFEGLARARAQPGGCLHDDRSDARRHRPRARPDRALTEIEQNVIDAVVKLMLEHLSETVAADRRRRVPHPGA